MARFFGRKKYGQSKTAMCPFCNRIATQMTKDGVNVCTKHVHSKLEEIKCTCGSWLEQKSGKYGPYFNCLNCGNFNFEKGMEIKALNMKKKESNFASVAKYKDNVKSAKDIVKETKEDVSSTYTKGPNKNYGKSKYFLSSYDSSKNKTYGKKKSDKKKGKKEIIISTDDFEYFS